MFERRISSDDVRHVLQTGAAIQEYPDDTPYPSRLVLSYVDGRPLHVVVADNDAAHETIIITVYEPDPAIWESDFRRKKV
jgi:hypothetical protein